MITEKYREKFNLSQSRLETMLCAVAVKNHGNGAHNPMAQFQKPISRETYLASKYVATPLRLYDCSPITDGAAAVVLTSEKTDVRLAGVGQGTGPLSLRGREIFTSFPATRMAAARARKADRGNPRAGANARRYCREPQREGEHIYGVSLRGQKFAHSAACTNSTAAER